MRLMTPSTTIFKHHDLERLLGRKFPLTIFIDSECLFPIIVKESMNTEERLMIDLRAVRN